MRVLRFEIGRAFKNIWFISSAAAGTVIGIADCVLFLKIHVNSNEEWSLSQIWLGTDYQFAFNSIFFALLPLIACLPYASTCYSDIKSGYERTVCVKTLRINYVIAKAVAVSLSGAAAVAIPLLIDLFVAAGLWGADVHFEPTISLMVTIYPISAVGLNTGSIWLTVVILPMLISLAMCLGQIFLEFLLTPAISFGIICLVYIISAYYTKWYFVGNYTMWQRSSYIADNGLNPMSGIVLAACIILLTLIGGTIYFDNKDII